MPPFTSGRDACRHGVAVVSGGIENCSIFRLQYVPYYCNNIHFQLVWERLRGAKTAARHKVEQLSFL
jgi:hypothetical protein